MTLNFQPREAMPRNEHAPEEITERAPLATIFVNLAGLPGWGSQASPTDPDTSAILNRYLGPVNAEIRLVAGCTALAVVPDVRQGLLATLDLLREAARSSGSASAGAHITHDAVDEVGPASHAARLATALADMAEADRLLVTQEVVAASNLADGSVLAFDAGPSADVDGERVITFSVRRL